jgi:hypothetical protein
MKTEVLDAGSIAGYDEEVDVLVLALLAVLSFDASW